MTLSQTAFGVAVVFVIFFTIIYLVKKGRLREEYSWMWLLTGLILFIVVLRYDILVEISQWIGAVSPANTLFLFGIIFLIFLSLHFAIKISVLTYEVKNLAQKISILEAEYEQGKPDRNCQPDRRLKP
ncbi:MAG: DUF2304 domain-containing protein [Thermodesulfobacteriota bacterium]